MASLNPFDLLGDDDSGDTATLQALPVEKKSAAKKQSKPSPAAQPGTAKLPSKPLPPAQAVREARTTGQNQGVRGGRGRGRGGIYSRDNEGYQGGRGRFYEGNEENFGTLEYGEGRGRGGRGGGGGRGGRGGRGSGGQGVTDDTERPRRREYERHSGTGRGNEMKREGSGRGNWGIVTDLGAFQEIEHPSFAEEEKSSAFEKQPEQGTVPANSLEKNQEEEEKEMTLDEYEKILEDRRKALQAKKAEERKVDVDKEFESMKQLTDRKHEEDVFVKLGSEKDKDRRNDIVGRVKRITMPVSINEFLKPTEGERYYAPGGRGRGRGRNDRGGFRGGFVVGNAPEPEPLVPQIEDPGQFPTLGGK